MTGNMVRLVGARLTADDPAALSALSGLQIPASDAAGVAQLVLDFSGVRAVDGFGIESLIRLAAECEDAGVELILAAPDRAVRTVFEIVRLHRRVTICDDLPPLADDQGRVT